MFAPKSQNEVSTQYLAIMWQAITVHCVQYGLKWCQIVVTNVACALCRIICMYLLLRMCRQQWRPQWTPHYKNIFYLLLCLEVNLPTLFEIPVIFVLSVLVDFAQRFPEICL